MRTFSLITLLSLLIGACGPSTNSKPKKEVSGLEVYKVRCVLCHGADGRMGMNGAKALPESTLSLEARIAVVTNGRKIMPAFKEMLSKEEIEAVAAYTMKFK